MRLYRPVWVLRRIIQSTKKSHRLAIKCRQPFRRERTMTMKHYGDVSKINGGDVEPFPIAVTKSRFKEVQNG